MRHLLVLPLRPSLTPSLSNLPLQRMTLLKRCISVRNSTGSAEPAPGARGHFWFGRDRIRVPMPPAWAWRCAQSRALLVAAASVALPSPGRGAFSALGTCPGPGPRTWTLRARSHALRPPWWKRSRRQMTERRESRAKTQTKRHFGMGGLRCAPRGMRGTAFGTTSCLFFLHEVGRPARGASYLRFPDPILPLSALRLSAATARIG
jgi:hypothetical protein